jgi:hypothetical protein
MQNEKDGIQKTAKCSNCIQNLIQNLLLEFAATNGAAERLVLHKREFII